MSPIVGGFGCFLRADDNSINIVDLTGYRCQVAVDDLADIPEHLTISLGDVVLTVPVRIESTAPFCGDDRGTPFVGGDSSEGGDQTDPQGSRLTRRVSLVGQGRASSASRDATQAGPDDTWNSSEIRDRRRIVEVPPAWGQRPTHVPTLARSQSPPMGPAISGAGTLKGPRAPSCGGPSLCPAVTPPANAVPPRVVEGLVQGDPARRKRIFESCPRACSAASFSNCFQEWMGSFVGGTDEVRKESGLLAMTLVTRRGGASGPSRQSAGSCFLDFSASVPTLGGVPHLPFLGETFSPRLETLGPLGEIFSPKLDSVGPLGFVLLRAQSRDGALLIIRAPWLLD